MSKEHFRHPPGEDHPSAKMKNKDVSNLKLLYCTGLYTRNELAEMFSISISKVHNLIAEYNWKTVSPDKDKLKGLPKKLGPHKRSICMPNETYGSWTIIGPLVGGNGKHIYYACQCACGNLRHVAGTKLLTGKSTRCHDCANKTTGFAKRKKDEK